MEIYLKRTVSGFVPMYDSDYENAKKYKIGDEVKAKLTKPRNLGFHKKAFALFNLCFENQDQYNSIDIMRGILTMKAGYFEEVKTDKGVVYWPKSISFSSMDQLEFEEYYSRVLDQVIKMIGSTSEEIESQLINFF